jgi:hypothetical protein
MNRKCIREIFIYMDLTLSRHNNEYKIILWASQYFCMEEKTVILESKNKMKFRQQKLNRVALYETERPGIRYNFKEFLLAKEKEKLDFRHKMTDHISRLQTSATQRRHVFVKAPVDEEKMVDRC